MKAVKSIFPILVLLLILNSCKQPQDKLIGKWVRYGDMLQGMCIEIQNEGGSFKAEIVSEPDSIMNSGFFVGDIKWRDIKKIAENKYEYVDLKKTPIPYSEPLRFKSENGLARLEVIGDTIINTRIFAKGDEVVGAETHWRKVEDGK